MRAVLVWFGFVLLVFNTACGDDGGSDGGAGMNGGDGDGDSDRDAGDGDGDRDAGDGDGGGDGDAGGDGGPSWHSGDPEDIGADLGDGETSAWTVFVYGHADHSLSNSFVRDVVEMAKAEIAGEVRVIVLADFDASQELADTGETFPVGAEWLRITGSNEEPQTLGTEPELDLDDPEVLAASVAAAFREFPSERRALVLWDHGGSWNGGFGGDTQNGTREGAPMTAEQVATAVAQGLADTDAKLDIFAFDTCLMSGAEVALEMHDLADVYIANAEIDYGDGWDYEAFLTHLSGHLDDTAQELAIAEVEQWHAHHVSASPNDTLLRSHVALDAARLPALATAVDALVSAVTKSNTLTPRELGRAGYFSLPPYMNQLENVAAVPELRDLGQFLKKMTGVSDATVASAAQDALEVLAKAILGRSQGELREASGQLGIHVELPLAAGLSDELLDAYAQLAPRWSEASHWPDALTLYRELDDQSAPALMTGVTNAENADAQNLPGISFSTPDADVAEVEINLGVVDPSLPDDLIVFGVIAKGSVDPDSEYLVEWDGQLVTLPDGSGGEQAIYVRVWEDVDSGGAMSAPPMLATFGIVELDGEEHLGALLFQDGQTETSLLSLLDPPVTLTLEEVARDLPGATFTPLLTTAPLLPEGEDGAVPGTPIPLDAASLPLSRSAAAAGTYALVASMYDVFGNASGDAQVVNLAASIE